MALPSLLFYNKTEEYYHHFMREYCDKPIITSDGIRVYFGLNKFSHAFTKAVTGMELKMSSLMFVRSAWIGLKQR